MPIRPLMTSGNVAVAVPRRGLANSAWRALAGTFAALCLVVNSGCQCCCCGTNAYSCLIDCLADHPPRAECLYCAKLDLTRINRPGGLQCRHCCCPPQPCCVSGVYAHRWNAPPAKNMSSTAGLQDAPTLPGGETGPYFPPAEARPPDVAPPATDGSPVPLFEQHATPMSPEPPAAAPPTTTPEPAAPPAETPPTDAGVVRMNYLTPDTAASAWHLPVNVLFGQ